jgi:hypothetical protein
MLAEICSWFIDGFDTGDLSKWSLAVASVWQVKRVGRRSVISSSLWRALLWPISLPDPIGNTS